MEMEESLSCAGLSLDLFRQQNRNAERKKKKTTTATLF